MRQKVTGETILESRRFSDRSRDHIQASKILDRLVDHFKGKLTLTSSQIVVGLKLINKVLPDLKQTELNAVIEHHIPDTFESLNTMLISQGVENPELEWDQLQKRLPQ